MFEQYIFNSGISFSSGNIPAIEYDTTKKMWREVAIQFLLWVKDHPTGHVALPVGHAARSFLQEIANLKDKWPKKELELYDLAHFPSFDQLTIVQTYEFLTPISGILPISKQILQSYQKLLDMAEEQFLLMSTRNGDLIKECANFEKEIVTKGGIGFFLTEIGIDGSILVNAPNTSFHTPVLIRQISYPVAAEMAIDFKGIARLRNLSFMTLGLGTLTHKKNATIILTASGPNKSWIVKDSIEKTAHLQNPSSCFQNMENASFFLTEGASDTLAEKQKLKIQNALHLSDELIDETLINIALTQKKTITSLSLEMLQNFPEGKALLNKAKVPFKELALSTHERLSQKFVSGLPSFQKKMSILHTTPHHDDIMLSYHPMIDHLQSHDQKVLCVTSGTNAITNSFLAERLEKCLIIPRVAVGSYLEMLEAFHSAYRLRDESSMSFLETAMLQHKVSELGELNYRKKIDEVLIALQRNESHPLILPLKAFIRECEEDRLWILHGLGPDQVIHLRAKFYQDMNCVREDVARIAKEIKKTNPDLITVALDPVATGPDTHHKVLQVIAQALKTLPHNPSLKIWGYRNIWNRFTFTEATHYFAVSEHTFYEQHRAFIFCYPSQVEALFPSPEFDGPFSKLAMKIQEEHYEKLQLLLGSSFFEAKAKDAQGLLLIKEMTTQEFLLHADSIQERLPWKLPLS